MSHLPRRSLRVAAVTSGCLALAVATLTVGHGTAAAEPGAGGRIFIELEVDDYSDCTEDPSNFELADFAIIEGAGSATVRVNGSATVTGEPGDVTTFEGGGEIKTTVQLKGGYLSTLISRGAGDLRVDRPADTACEVEASMEAGSGVDFDLLHAGWLEASAAVGRDGNASIEVFGEDGTTLHLGAGRGEGGIRRTKPYTGAVRGEVAPGSYGVDMRFRWSDRPDYGYLPSRAARAGTDDGTLTLKFIREGSAKSGVKGSGKKYVTPASQRNCSAGKLSVSLTKQAKKAKKIQIFAGSKKVKTIGKPKKGTTSVKLKKSVRTVKAVVQLKGGGRATGKRTYEPCL